MELPIILWINLERAEIRREKMIKHFTDFDIDNVKINAIDFSNFKFNDRIKDIHKTAIACGASHLKSLKYFVDNHQDIGDYCLIMEDDIDIKMSLNLWSKNFWEYISIFENENWSVIQLQVSLHKKSQNKYYNTYFDFFEKEFKKNKPIKWIYNFFGTGVYLIHISRAKEIINNYQFKNPMEYINRYNNYNYYMKMQKNKMLSSDHYMIYNDKTYTLPLFFSDFNIKNYYINNDKNHINTLNKINKKLYEFMKKNMV